MRGRLALGALLTVAALGCGGGINDGRMPRFVQLPLLRLVQETTATGASSNGLQVCGWTNSVPGGQDAAGWNGYAAFKIPAMVAGGQGLCRGISPNGDWFAGTANAPSYSQHAFRWSAATGPQDLGALGDSDYSEGCAVSDDGSVVVGFSPPSNEPRHAFRWTATDGMQDLGTFGGSISSATGVSADGTRIVGFANLAGDLTPHAFLWTQGTGLMDIDGLSPASGANAISADGTVIVGMRGSNAFKWTEAGGMVDLPARQPEESCSAHGVSADGTIIVGQSGNSAVLWNATGIVDLGVAFASRIPSGWVLNDAVAVSSNGRLVIGNASVGGHSRGFVLDISP